MVQSNLISWIRKIEKKHSKTATEEHVLDGLTEEPERVTHRPRPISQPVSSHNMPHGSREEGTYLAVELGMVQDRKLITQSLPVAASIESCSKTHLKAFQRMTRLLLPIPYADSFWRETMEDPIIASLTRLAVWDESSTIVSATARHDAQLSSKSSRVVAGIRCRLLAHPPGDATDQQPVVYISILETLSPFRAHGLASYLLLDVMRIAARDYAAKVVMAHVWEANDEAIKWYLKRGFRVVARDADYYRRLAPNTTALIIRKDLTTSELIGWPEEPS